MCHALVHKTKNVYFFKLNKWYYYHFLIFLLVSNLEKSQRSVHSRVQSSLPNQSRGSRVGGDRLPPSFLRISSILPSKTRFSRSISRFCPPRFSKFKVSPPQFFRASYTSARYSDEGFSKRLKHINRFS